MNIFLYNNFVQLFPVKNNTLYTLFIAFKSLVIVITRKISYNVFIEMIVLTNVMQQQGDLLSAS